MRRSSLWAPAALSLVLLANGAMSCSSPSGAGNPPPSNGAGGTNAGAGGTRAAGGSDGNGSGGQAGSAIPPDAGSSTPDGGRGAGGTGGAAAGTGGAVVATGGAGGTTTGTASISLTPSWPTAAIVTGVRDVVTPAATQTVQLRNDGTTPVTVTAISLAGTDASAFRLTGVTTPLSLAAGASIPVIFEVLTTGAALPAAPPQNSGGTLLTATLSATSANGGVTRATVYGLLLTTATHEVTLGQILTTLGITLNVGLAQNNANPNTGTVQELPKVEAGTDEIAAPLFHKLGSGNVTLEAVARFSPKGPMPFGWYPAGMPGTRNTVATMASMPDAQTSDKARMVLPPLTGSTGFDPGTATFGLWVYTDQLSQLYDTGGTATNGDYDYSEDAANSPANVHRMKVYPLKNAAGVAVAGSYLVAVEEAGNGDYQDYVFILSNVTPAN